jgi:multidrug resistance efflux pump
MERRSELVTKGVISREEFDRGKAQLGSLEAELRQAQASQREAEEKLKAGGSRTLGTVQEMKRAEAEANEIRVELQSESGGVNPKVRQTMAELDMKRWELEHTVVRAPSAGIATQVALRPGQMTTPIPLAPVMIFVPSERPTLVASFSQTVIPELEEGLEAELAFKAHPGRVFKAKVSRLVPIIPEGQFTASGQLRSATAATAPGRVPVVFEYGEDVAALEMPIGAQATVAIYTHKVHALSIVRKIILRIKSWENYLFFIGH